MQRRSEDDAGRGDLWFLSRVAALLLAIPVIILLLIVGFPACTDCENSIDNDNNGELYVLLQQYHRVFAWYSKIAQKLTEAKLRMDLRKNECNQALTL